MLRFALGDYFFTDSNRKDVTDYFLQISEEKMLQIQGNDKSDWSCYTLFLGRISTDFRKLL